MIQKCKAILCAKKKQIVY